MTDERIVRNVTTKKWFEGNVSKTHYWIDFCCTNCGHKDAMALQKGVRQDGIKVDCARCGCEEELRAVK